MAINSPAQSRPAGQMLGECDVRGALLLRGASLCAGRRDQPEANTPNRGRLSEALHEYIAVRRAFSDQVVALAHLVGRPLRTHQGTRIARITDIAVRWDADATHPPVTGVVVSVGAVSVSSTCQK